MLVLAGVSTSCGSGFRRNALALSNGWSVRLPLATEFSNSIPNRRTSNANSQKHTTVITTQASRVGQKPRRGSSRGKARNIGSVGTTYRNVYQAWLAIFDCGWRSTYSQISANTVTSGSAASRPPRRSLRLATSETSTTTAAVIRYLVTSHPTGRLLGVLLSCREGCARRRALRPPALSRVRDRLPA
jgi:hypothetical protein